MLLDKLIHKQQILGESDKKFALRLGVDRTTWRRTRTKDIRIAESVLSGTIKSFPELSEDVIIFLASDGNTFTDNSNALPETKAS